MTVPIGRSCSPLHVGGRDRGSIALAAGGVGLAGMAMAVPWLTVFRGLQPLPGFVLEGGPLGGILLASAALLVVGRTFGGMQWLKPIAFAAASLVAADAVLLQGRIAEYVANPGPAAPLTQPTAGIGAGLLAMGSVLVALAALLAPGSRAPLRAGMLSRLVMATGLFVAGWIHLMLVPEHVAESEVLGLGFLASGVAQLVLAALVLWRARTWNLGAVMALNLTLIAIYAYAVLVGLPFGDFTEHGSGSVGLAVGAGERIDLLGALSKIAELGSSAIAFGLLGRTGLETFALTTRRDSDDTRTGRVA